MDSYLPEFSKEFISLNISIVQCIQGVEVVIGSKSAGDYASRRFSTFRLKDTTGTCWRNLIHHLPIPNQEVVYKLDLSPVSFAKEHLKVIKEAFAVISLNAKRSCLKEKRRE